MNDKDMRDALERLTETIRYNTTLTEQNAQLTDRLGSDQKAMRKELAEFNAEMKPWLETKIGLNLVWNWFVKLPIFMASLWALKELITWTQLQK